MINSDTVIRRLDGMVEAEVDGEILALHVEQGTCYAFNVTAARVWSALAEPRSLAELRDELLAEFAIDADTCERELVGVLDQLAAQGLVTTAPDAELA